MPQPESNEPIHRNEPVSTKTGAVRSDSVNLNGEDANAEENVLMHFRHVPLYTCMFMMSW
jgi:hypothetical protein